MSQKLITGLHHVTAVASTPQKNYDFYHGVLGLRLVKQTVNFDDPSSYHLYYGDDLATPGTLITFFTWPHLPARTHGKAEINTVGFAIPPQSIEFWTHRLSHLKINFTKTTRGPYNVIAFEDYDGMNVELAEVNSVHELKAKSIHVPNSHAICGIEYVVLQVENLALCAQVLETIEFQHVTSHDEVHQFTNTHSHVFVIETKAHDAVPGIGSIHHVAFATPNDDTEELVRSKITNLDLHPTHQIDRNYFHSVYFREHNMILFEIATSGPGFTIDEPLKELGKALKLPVQYEARRKEITANLPKLAL
jgi:glyoxalase family protein